jgi:hypothetical protein
VAVDLSTEDVWEMKHQYIYKDNEIAVFRFKLV